MRKIVLAFGFAAALASPALAREKLSPTPDDLSVQAIHNYAACIVETTSRGAEEALSLDYASEAYRKKLDRIAKGHADSRCMTGGQFRSSGVLLAGGMAERLVLEKLSAATFATRVAYDAGKPPAQAHDAMEMTAMCVVRAAPDKTWTIFTTAPTSREELGAMQAIGSTLAGCVPAGQKMAFNRPGVRAVLALAAYHLTQPAAPAQGS